MELVCAVNRADKLLVGHAADVLHHGNFKAFHQVRFAYRTDRAFGFQVKERLKRVIHLLLLVESSNGSVLACLFLHR